MSARPSSSRPWLDDKAEAPERREDARGCSAQTENSYHAVDLELGPRQGEDLGRDAELERREPGVGEHVTLWLGNVMSGS